MGRKKKIVTTTEEKTTYSEKPFEDVPLKTITLTGFYNPDGTCNATIKCNDLKANQAAELGLWMIKVLSENVFNHIIKPT